MYHSFGKVSLATGLALTLLRPCLAVAEPGFALNGFGTLGVARTTEDSAELVRDLSQPDGLNRSWRFENDSLLGLQARLNASSDLDAVVQVVSRYRYDSSFSPELTWAFLRYAPNPIWTLRAGRMGTEFYLLADSRMVGYSYLTVRPPVDFYGTFPFNFMDGMDLTAALPVAGGLLRGKAYFGISQEQSPLGGGAPDFDLSGSLLVGGHLDFFAGHWQFRIGHSQLTFEQDLPLEQFYRALPEPTADALRVAGNWTSFSSLGVVYDGGPLQTQAMLSRVDNGHGTFQDAWAGYLLASYRLGEFTPFIGLSSAKSTPKSLDRPLPVTDFYQNDFHTDQRSLFFGARWDFWDDLCLKAQLDIIRGDPDSRFLYRAETPAWDGSMTALSLTLDFVF